MIIKRRVVLFLLIVIVAFTGLLTSLQNTDDLNLIGEWVVFGCSTPGYDGWSSVYAIRPSGEELTQVVSRTTVSMGSPTWSPNGEWILIMNNRRLQIINPITGNRSQVIREGSYGLHAWSPDNQQIAFISDLNNPDRQGLDIYTINVDNRNFQRVTFLNSFAFGSLDWSPDGQWIIFENDGNLYQIHPDGTDQRLLLDLTGRIFSPQWSPNGEQIAFILREELGQADIYILNTITNELISITSEVGLEYFRSPSWSPDGQQIIFSANPDFGNTGFNIFRIQVDGTNLFQISDMQDCIASSPSWRRPVE